MKKIAFTAIVALAFGFTSCKKDRTCTCTYNKTGSSSVETEITTYSNVSKKSALATCTSGSSYELSDPSNVKTRNCTLD